MPGEETENVGTGTTEDGGSPEDSGQTQDGSQDLTATGADDGDTGETQTQAPIVVGGKEFGSVDDLVNAYTNSEKRLGELKNEVGTLRQQQQQPAKPVPPPPPDFSAQIGEIEEKLNAGDISVGEALRLNAEIMQKQADVVADQKYQAKTQEKALNDAYNSFLDKNPDFDEVRSSGELEGLKRANPLHDDFSAYLEWKANSVKGAVEKAVKEAVSKERAAWEKTKKGAESVTGKALTGSGSGAPPAATGAEVLSDADQEASMLAAIKAARGQG